MASLKTWIVHADQDALQIAALVSKQVLAALPFANAVTVVIKVHLRKVKKRMVTQIRAILIAIQIKQFTYISGIQ